MSPPGLMATTARRAGSWNSGPGQDRDRLINEANAILANADVVWSASRVRRMVLDYERNVERNGVSFTEFFANSVAISDGKRKAARAANLNKPDNRRVVSYADPTGETAVNNVLRGMS